MAQQPTTRRQFLTGQSALEAISGWANELPPDGGLLSVPGSEDRESYLLHLSRHAMACEFQVYLNAGQYPDAVERAVSALDLIEELEDQLSVFRAHSEVSRLNQRAAVEPVCVEPRLFGLIEQAVTLWRETGRAYDITAGPLSKTWGFFRRQGHLPSDEEIAAALAQVGSQYLLLNAEDKTVAFAQPGLEINLGSIGKGHALDRAAELLSGTAPSPLGGEGRGEGLIDDFLVHGGNSSVLARGGRENRESGWLVGLPHPLRPNERLGEFRLRDAALGTSGSVAQFFWHAGRRYGHILDPRSGWPAEGVLSATVRAPTAALADALSTALFVLGPAGAEKFCSTHRDIGAVLVCPAAREGGVEIWKFNLDSDEWQTQRPTMCQGTADEGAMPL